MDLRTKTWRLRRAGAALVVGAIGVGVAGVGAPAAHAARAACAIVPFEYTHTEFFGDDNGVGERTFGYVASGESTLDCPDGHRLDGAAIGLTEHTKVTDHPPYDDGSGTSKLVGRTSISVSLDGRSLLFDGTVAGSLIHDVMEINMEIRANGPNGARLNLVQQGDISFTDQVLHLAIADGATTGPKLAFG